MIEPRANGIHEGLQLIGTGKAFRDPLCHMIASTHMFRDFDWHDIETLSEYTQAYEAPKGLTLFKEGDIGNYVCLIIKGKVDVYKRDLNDNEKIVAQIGAGKTLGEMAIIDGELRSASAITAEQTDLILLTKDNFLRILNEKPGLAARILLQVSRLLSQRLRRTSGQLVDYLEH